MFQNVTAGQFLATVAIAFVLIVAVGLGLGFAGLYVAMNIVLIVGLPVVLLGLVGFSIYLNRY